MAAYADTIARQFVQGTRPNKSHRLYAAHFSPDPAYIGGVNTNEQPDAPEALYSYGPHYPVTIKEQDPERTVTHYRYWVNETPYHTSEEERYAAGFRPGLFGPSRRQPRTGSPTTNGHRKSVESALRAAGYRPTDQAKEITTERPDGDQMTHALRLWTRS